MELAILLVLGIIIVLPALVGFAIVGFFILRNRRARAKWVVAQLVCRVDADCPSGYVCSNGVCVPTHS